MVINQKRFGLCVFLLVICHIVDVVAIETIEPLSFDMLYPETPVSRVLRTMKQLFATMTTVKERETKRDDCVLANIIEIQSLSVTGALQELGRAIQKGLIVNEDHQYKIHMLWKSLRALACDEKIERYLNEYCGFE